MVRYHQLKMKPGYSIEDVRQKLAACLRISLQEIRQLEILKESIDARKKPDIYYVLSVAFACDREQELLKKYGKKGEIAKYEEKRVVFPKVTQQQDKQLPVIIGAGPAGLFCAYYLAKAGLHPIVLERGKAVEERMADVAAFWETGVLCPDSNVQFGEGGAGTFSDGKLNTLNKDTLGYQREILQLFVAMGANPAILYEQRPHLGTDKLVDIVQNLREEIIRMGGEVRFEAKVTDFLIDKTEYQNKIYGVIVNETEQLLSKQVILAIGHSARDTFLQMEQCGFQMEPKAFAVGYRVQHPQKMIDASQYGVENLGKFPPAPYKLTAQTACGRGVYSFCMCPGGYVVNSSSEEGMLCINGMSYSDRGGENANSAIIVSVTPEDFPDRGALSGMYFQRELEQRAYQAAQGRIPLQRLEDYKLNRASERAGTVSPVMKGVYGFTNLRGILPAILEEAFLDGMEQFERKIHGYTHPDTLLAGIEARTSSPVRITRDDRCQSVSVKGVYPCGEGAGYAGGITSAAMDGLRVALAVMKDLGGESL
jgi:uncharacterized FAD-dependent dehydrogenase